MLIAIQDYYFYGALAIAVLLFMASLVMYFSIKNHAPEAFTHWKASRNGDKICRVHWRGRKASDYIATLTKEEKEVGTPYWTVPGLGMKFKPEPEDIEFIEGSIPCVNYYEVIPEGQKVSQVVAFSQLKDYFAKIGLPIKGLEDVYFYVASEAERLKTKGNAILNARVDSAETREYLQKFLNTIEARKKELSNLQLQSGVFTWQTAMKALDSTIAYTSFHLEQTAETIRAAEKRKHDNETKNYMLYAIITVILAIAGIILLFGIKAFTG